jgi:hypothetical protein
VRAKQAAALRRGDEAISRSPTRARRSTQWCAADPGSTPSDGTKLADTMGPGSAVHRAGRCFASPGERCTASGTRGLTTAPSSPSPPRPWMPESSQIKSGHDKLAPAARSVRVFTATMAQKTEGAGNAGCVVRTHSLACEMKKHTSVVTTGTPPSAGIPRAMVLTVSFELSLVTGLFCHHRLRGVSGPSGPTSPCRRLDISVGMSGPHDFAVCGERSRPARQEIAPDAAASIASPTQRP